MTVILIHGWGPKEFFYDPDTPTPNNFTWFPWLQKQLLIRDIFAVSLIMPKAWYPEYEAWKKELERFELNEDTILVGHSCGGGFLVRYLSENNVKVGKVILVAPWIGILSPDNKDPFDETFFKFEIDKNLASKTDGLVMFESTNDDQPVQESVEILKKSLNDMKVITMENMGHFTFGEVTGAPFPELLAEVLK